MFQNKNYCQERKLKLSIIFTLLLSKVKQQLLFKIKDTRDMQHNWELLFQLLTCQSIKSSWVLNG